MHEKKIPQNIEAEKAVIASMFLAKYALQKATEELSKEVFFLDSHAKIFEVIRDLNDNNKAIDITTVSDELEKRKILNQIGGVEYLSEIINSIASPANIDEYINIIEEKATINVREYQEKGIYYDIDIPSKLYHLVKEYDLDLMVN